MSKTPIRVLLIYPPSSFQNHSGCPMGILMLAAVLDKPGYDVRILDANAAGNKRTSEQIIRFVQEIKPDVIGMTLVTPLIREAYKLAQGLKEQGAILLAGGPHATLVPEEPLSKGFDAVVKGEGEPIIEDAVKALLGEMPKENVNGWVYKDTG
ncbi:MAG: cobalamin B12-binding domain-containing protein, partial [Sedimentisphaerales bacterium]|nr:cobalamin B12-binding domain-containing protein [Sedimentisphaerales bacterium]